MRNDIEWLEATKYLKEQRDRAISIAKLLYKLSYCGCAITECTCGLDDTKRELEKLELETCEYPLHWGGVEVCDNLKKLFNTGTKLAEAKVFPLNEQSESFISNCITKN